MGCLLGNWQSNILWDTKIELDGFRNYLADILVIQSGVYQYTARDDLGGILCTCSDYFRGVHFYR